MAAERLETEFGNLENGDRFWSNNEQYMKIHFINEDNSSFGKAVRLSDGSLCKFKKTDIIQKIYSNNNSEDAFSIADILDLGQGDDDTVYTIISSLEAMSDGYYALDNLGPSFWSWMNQFVQYDEAMAKVWSKVNWKELGNALDMSLILTIGAYIRSDKFTEVLKRFREKSYDFSEKSFTAGAVKKKKKKKKGK